MTTDTDLEAAQQVTDILESLQDPETIARVLACVNARFMTREDELRIDGKVFGQELQSDIQGYGK